MNGPIAITLLFSASPISLGGLPKWEWLIFYHNHMAQNQEYT
jgi:hypothetical protein